MNSPYDDDTFAMQFDDAINAMHHRHPAAPGIAIWQQIESRVSRAETADPRAFDPDLATISSERKNKMDAALTGVVGERRTTPSRGVSAWIAATVVLMLVVSGFYLNTLRPGDGRDQRLAWAPATPDSTPRADVACTVTPLTTDEVMATVMNPANGYVRLGMTEYANSTDKLWESRNPQLNAEPEKVGFVRNGDRAVLAEAADAANMYSNCVQNGTLFQVWAIMDPSIVQEDVLSRFPVLRTEEQLRSFVEEWGPQPFPGEGGGIIGRFPGQAMTNSNTDWLGSTMINGRTNDLAIISIYDHESGKNQGRMRTEVTLQLYPNGQWVITGLYSPQGAG